jgi:(p)ppGpp synthase/HD superfamily hydrolase
MMLEDSTLNKILEFATKAHGSQRRKYSDERYIEHPLRVMNMCRQYVNDMAVLGAALLHDVLEDTPVEKQDLEKFLMSITSRDLTVRMLSLVEDLTDVFTKDRYPHLNRRQRRESEMKRLAKVDADAQTIKYADIIDNTDVTWNDPEFAKVFLSECKKILVAMDRGNEALRQKAIGIVDDCLLQIRSGRPFARIGQ